MIAAIEAHLTDGQMLAWGFTLVVCILLGFLAGRGATLVERRGRDRDED